MKKNFINLAMVAMVAVGTVAYTGCGKKGCTTETDDNYDSAATEADPEACDATATDGKFAGNWTFQISGAGTYSVNVTDASADYSITANTDLGLDGVSAQNITLSVDQAIASNSSVTLGNATISDLKFEWKTASTATLSGTISGTGGAADGAFSDNGTK